MIRDSPGLKWLTACSELDQKLKEWFENAKMMRMTLRQTMSDTRMWRSVQGTEPDTEVDPKKGRA